MLHLSQGPAHRYCDGLSRRNFLRVGGLGLAGLTLADPSVADAAKMGRASCRERV